MRCTGSRQGDATAVAVYMYTLQVSLLHVGVVSAGCSGGGNAGCLAPVPTPTNDLLQHHLHNIILYRCGTSIGADRREVESLGHGGIDVPVLLSRRKLVPDGVAC